MAVKTFTSEVLTSSDTNTYLANSGLVYVTNTTPTAASTIAVSSCFSSAYDNYKIVITPVISASAGDIRIKLRSGGTASSTSYYMTNMYNTGTTLLTSSETNQTSWRGVYCGTGGTDGKYNSLTFDLYGPFLATATRYDMQSSAWDGTAISNRSATGFHDQSTSYDSFELSAGSSIYATISVYGYRKP